MQPPHKGGLSLQGSWGAWWAGVRELGCVGGKCAGVGVKRWPEEGAVSA